MADDLEEVRQQFTAEMTEYLGDLQHGSDDAVKFAAANGTAADSLTKVRDDAAEAAAALAAYDEEAGQAGSAQSNFSASTEKAASDLSRLHDESLSAGDAQKQAGEDTDTFRSKLNALGSDLQSRGNSLRDASLAVTGVGDAMGAASSDAGMFSRVMAGANLATGLAEPLMAGLVVTTAGLASGLVAAGAGLGVFGLVAKSAYSQVSAAVTAYGTAQSTTGKASATAMAQYKADLAALTPAQQQFARAITGAQNAWQNFVASNTAGVTQILDKGLGLLPKILSAIQPLLAPVEAALSGLISQLGHGLDSSGFKSFMATLEQNTGPAITKLGDAIGHIVAGIGGILKAFMPASQGILSGLDQLTAKFAAWGSTLSSHSGFQSLMETFKTETPLAVALLKNLATVIKNVADTMTGLSTGANSKALLQVLDPLSGVLASLSKNTDLVRAALYALAAADAGKKISGLFSGISSGLTVIKGGASAFTDLQSGFANSAAAASEATGVWGTVGGKLSTIGSSLVSAGAAAGRFAVDLAATAIKTTADFAVTAAKAVASAAVTVASFLAEAAAATVAFIAENLATLGIVAAIALLIAGIVLLATHWQQVWGDIKNWAVDAWQFLDNDVIHPIADAVSWLWHTVVTFFTSMVTGAQSQLAQLGSFVASLPGKILGWVGDLGSLLYNAGLSLIDGFLKGIEAMVGPLLSYAESIASDISSVFSTVLKMGSPSRLFYEHGVNTLQGYIDGVKAMVPQVQAAMRGAGGQVAAGGIGGAATGAGAPSVHVTVPVTLGAGTQGYNTPQFLQYIQQAMQEATLRYTQINPSNGLNLAGKL